MSVPVERIPPGVDAKAALYRTQLQRQRVLVVLDNASSAEQVRPLLPGSPGCMVVVTSRSRLASLSARDGARQVRIDPLPAAEAITLLRQVIGAPRVDAEPGAVVDLARHCGYLPLALRIAADRVAARSHVGLADVSGELACEQDRLDLLATVDDDEATAVRAVFSWSFRGFAGRGRPDVPAAGPARRRRSQRCRRCRAGRHHRAAGTPATGGVDRRAPARVRTGPDRYRLHDLLRVYAAERAASEETDHDRATAVARMLAWYLHTATATGRALDCGPTFDCQRRYVVLGSAATEYLQPSFTTHEQSLAWFKTECANLVAAVGQASDAGQYDIAWKLPLALSHFFDVDKPTADWIGVHHIGLAATRLHDRLGEACILADLGSVYRYFQQVDVSLDCRRRSLNIFREINDQWGEALMLCVVGSTHRRLGQFDQAVDHLQQGLAVWCALGNRSGEASALNRLGECLRDLRRNDDSLAHHQRALAIQHEIGLLHDEGSTLCHLGLTYQQLQRHQEAIGCLHQAAAVYRLTTSRRFGSRHHEAEALCLLGDLLHDNGQSKTASECWHQALAIYDDLDAPQAADVAARLARLRRGGRSRPRSATAARARRNSTGGSSRKGVIRRRGPVERHGPDRFRP